MSAQLLNDHKKTLEELKKIDWWHFFSLTPTDLRKFKSKLGMKFRKDSKFPDPEKRLDFVMNYLVTRRESGEGHLKELEIIFDEISKGLKDYIPQWPDTEEKYVANAGLFYQKYGGVKDCIGAVMPKCIRVNPVGEHKSAFKDSRKSETTFFYSYPVIDATFKILFSGIAFPGEDENLPLEIINERSREFPILLDAQTGRWTATRIYGGGLADLGKSYPWLVLPKEKPKAAFKIHMTTIRPFEVVDGLLNSHYFSLTSNVDVPSEDFCGRMIRAIHTLHNYFVATNHAAYLKMYADPAMRCPEVSELAEMFGVDLRPFQDIPRQVLDEDKPWMDKIHLTKDVLRALAEDMRLYVKMGMEDMVRGLRNSIRYLVTGEGKNEFSSPDLINRGVLYSVLSMPMRQETWIRMAGDYAMFLGLTNCMGVVVTQKCSPPMAPPAGTTYPPEAPVKVVNVHVMVVEYGRKIVSLYPVMQKYKKNYVAKAVDAAMGQNFGFPITPGPKNQFLLMGNDKMMTHRLLATAKSPGHFTPDELKRAEALGEKFQRTLGERFACIAQLDKDPKGGEYFHAVTKLHNYLMMNSDTYDEAFTDEWMARLGFMNKQQ